MAIAPIITTPNDFSPSAPGTWSPLPTQRPLLLVGHGSRDTEGRDRVLEFAAAYQALDTSRPVIPCFLSSPNPPFKTA
jgi:sirohydrochlorin cobaltochelatase